MPCSDFKPCISQYILSTWQDDWNGAVENWLHSVKPVLEIGSPPTGGAGRMNLFLGRARIDHTHLTHSYILKKDPPPQCERCRGILTVCHILVECNNFAERKEICNWWERCGGIF